jgi:chemotaxis protein MotA
MAETKKSSSRPDFATLAGIVIALGGLIGGLILEKGEIRDIAQITAAIIVLGGTFGAVLVSMPMRVVVGALKRVKEVVFEKSVAPDHLIDEIIDYAAKARKNGLVSLETDAEVIADPFLKKAIMLAVDGTDLQEIRKMLELEISLHEQHAETEAKVFESAGGYAPTVGIIGAVMGLIQVMKHLSNTDEVGRGIATAFVATVYGVGMANIILLPMATKIKNRAQHETQMKELIVEGVAGIVEGLNPKLIRSKLEAYGRGKAASRPRAAAPARAAKPAPAAGD